MLVGFSWQSLITAKQDYDVTHRNYSAFLWAVSLLRHHLEGWNFTVQMNDDALWEILSISNATEKLAESSDLYLNWFLNVSIVPSANIRQHLRYLACMRLKRARPHSTMHSPVMTITDAPKILQNAEWSAEAWYSLGLNDGANPRNLDCPSFHDAQWIRKQTTALNRSVFDWK